MRGASFLVQMIVFAVIALVGASIYMLVIHPRIFQAADLVKASCDENQAITDSCICFGSQVSVRDPPLYCCSDGIKINPCVTS